MKKIISLFLILSLFLIWTAAAIAGSGIGEVIGWKFDHQSGMTTKEGRITVFPGGIPSQALQGQWTAEYQQNLLDTAYIANRGRSLARGGYGTHQEQLKMIGEQGIAAFQVHIEDVKVRHPKPVN